MHNEMNIKHPNFQCAVCGHRASGIFCNLLGSHLHKLDQEKTVHTYRGRQILFYEGNPSFAIYCVASGLIKLYKSYRKGDQYILRLLGPGNIAGYCALLQNEPYAATAEALEPSTVCIITRETLLQLMRESSDLTFRLLARMAQEVRTAEEQMLSLVHESVRQRTARILLFLMQSNHKEARGSAVLRVPLLRSEMAQMVGTTPETFSRTLHELAQEGVLRVTRKGIIVENLTALQNMAAGQVSPT